MMNDSPQSKPWFDETTAANGLSVKENFQAWFSESKVVHWRTGEPLVVYHGTSADIRAFDPAKTGSVHFDLEAGPVFFFTDDLPTANWYAKDASKKSKGGANLIPVFLSLQNPLVVDFQGEGLEYLAEEIQNARDKGCDGLIARNYDDGGVADHYIAFHPEQIKSALGNSGLYLKDSPEMDDRSAAQALELANAARARIPAKKFHKGRNDERFALVF
jgi:hypothetical protein